MGSNPSDWTEARIWFQKTGRVKFISHLDLTRCFARAFTRARIPLWYTEGFNPRPYMNFSMPLTLGVEGMREAVDIRMQGDMPQAEIGEKLAAVMPPDIKILEVTDPVHKLNEVVASRYEFTIQQDTMPMDALKTALKAATELPELKVEKIGKKGKNKVMKTVNLAEHHRNISLQTEGDALVLSCILPSSTSFGINPRLYVDRLLSEVGVEPTVLQMVRTELLLEEDQPFC